MALYNERILSKLKEIAYKKYDFEQDHERIVSECPKKLMSRGIDLYGMFYPNQEIGKYHEYKGKLTTNKVKRNYCYFFDAQDRLRLTERYDDNGSLLNIIYFYYYKDKVEIVWYKPSEGLISIVGYVDYKEGVLHSFVETIHVPAKRPVIDTYVEHVFDEDEEYMLKKTFSKRILEKGKPYERCSKFKKH